MPQLEGVSACEPVELLPAKLRRLLGMLARLSTYRRTRCQSVVSSGDVTVVLTCFGLRLLCGGSASREDCAVLLSVLGT